MTTSRVLSALARYGAVTLALLLLAGGTAVAQSGGDDYQPPHDRPGPAMDRIQFRSFNVDLAPREIQRNAMDMYIFNLKTEGAQSLRDDPGVKLFQAPAQSIALGLNPAPAPEFP